MPTDVDLLREHLRAAEHHVREAQRLGNADRHYSTWRPFRWHWRLGRAHALLMRTLDKEMTSDR